MTSPAIIERTRCGDEPLGSRAVVRSAVCRRLSEVVRGLLDQLRDRRIESDTVVVPRHRKGEPDFAERQGFEVIHDLNPITPPPAGLSTGTVTR